MYAIKALAYSFKGNYRENNEDNYYINGKFMKEEHTDNLDKTFVFGDKASLFGVFDGLGGEDKGETASYIAAKTLSEFKENFDSDVYFKRANEEICKLYQENTKKRIGTTACIVSIKGKKATVANIGDSKIFLFRKGKLLQLSEEHTTLSAMLKSGVLTNDDISKFGLKNSLSQCLGIRESEMIIKPYSCDVGQIQNGDIFLICSDGVSNGVSDDEICSILKKKNNFAKKIVEKAVSNGSKDNATAVVIKVYKGLFRVIGGFLH